MSSLKTEERRRGRPPKVRTHHLEKYTLHEERPTEGEKPGRWLVSGRNLTGSYKRIRFDAFSLSHAQKRAEEILFSRSLETPEMTLAQAFARVIGTRTVTPETRDKYRRFAGYFCEWVEKKGIRNWGQLRFEHVHDYMRALFDRGCKTKTVCHYLEPIRFSALWMHRTWPERYANFCTGLRVPNEVRQTFVFDEQKPRTFLTVEEVIRFLEWIQENHDFAPVLVPGVALQGLCGLQLQEALRLTVEKVNLDAGTLTIDGKVKNRWRVRRLPMPEKVQEILKGVVESTPEEDLRIVRHGSKNWKAYSSLVEGALDRWAGGRRPMAPKDLRNTLPTEAAHGGWDGYFVNRYLGHSPQTMAERHYLGEASKSGRDLVVLLRENVVRHIDLLVRNCTMLHDHGGKVVSLHGSR